MSSDEEHPPMPPLQIPIVNLDISTVVDTRDMNNMIPCSILQEARNDLFPHDPDGTAHHSSDTRVQPLANNLMIQSDQNTDSNNVVSQDVSFVVPGSVSYSSQQDIFNYSKIPENGIVLPREKNKIFHDLLRYDLNIDQVSYYKDTITTHRAKQYHSLELESERVNFMNALMREHFKQKRVFKYNEVLDVFTELSRKSLYSTIRDKLINIRAYQKCIKSKTSKRCHTSSNPITKEKSKIENMVQSRSFSFTAYEKSHPYSRFYLKRNELHDMHNWHYYSMFHSLYQSFSIVVYNYSHRLADSETIHRCTRLKINIPKNANAILITHGRLVHSGCASKSENNLSYNHSHDLRLFSELYRDLHNFSSTSNPSSTAPRRSSRNEVDSTYHNHTPYGEVDRKTFSMCPANCTTCVNISGTKELNLEDIYKDLNLRIGLTHRGKPPKKIVGDLYKFGWVIYTGVNVHHKNYVCDLDDEFSNLVKNKPKRMWHGIGGTERRVFKLDEFMIDDPNKALNETKTVAKLFDDIHSHVLNKIPAFKDKVTMKKRSLLANFGIVEEQQPHRDFGSSKCNDKNSMNTNI